MPSGGILQGQQGWEYGRVPHSAMERELERMYKKVDMCGHEEKVMI